MGTATKFILIMPKVVLRMSLKFDNRAQTVVINVKFLASKCSVLYRQDKLPWILSSKNIARREPHSPQRYAGTSQRPTEEVPAFPPVDPKVKPVPCS